jgi:hypothetical protein
MGNAMSDKQPREILLNPENKPIHAAIGQAIDSYAMVEGSQVFILEAILAIPPQMASVVFFSVQNVRSRHEMMQAILAIKHVDKYKKFWGKCGAFLQKLADFRNAVVHWHPVVAVYLDKKGAIQDHGYELKHGSAGNSFLPIRTRDFPDFLKDCQYIQQELLAFNGYLKGDSAYSASQDRFLQPNLRRNLAVLRQPPKLKEPQPPPKSSRASAKRPKPSSKQRRLRALAAQKRQRDV